VLFVVLGVTLIKGSSAQGLEDAIK